MMKLLAQIGVIVAADKNVEMNRFAGKAVLERPVSDGIRKSEELIRKAVASDAPIYHASGEKVLRRMKNLVALFGVRFIKI